MRKTTLAFVTALLGACDAAGTAAQDGRQPPHAAPAEAVRSTTAQASGPAELASTLDRVREVTAPFHDTAAAADAGYTPTDHCVESLAGGMGHHFVNRALLDDRLEVERPEILVYAPGAGGALKLAGVEYAVPYSAWPHAEPPRILGQDLRRSDGLQLWYLHVWLWERNPSGLFADWNPHVRCTGGRND